MWKGTNAMITSMPFTCGHITRDASHPGGTRNGRVFLIRGVRQFIVTEEMTERDFWMEHPLLYHRIISVKTTPLYDGTTHFIDIVTLSGRHAAASPHAVRARRRARRCITTTTIRR